MTRRERLERKLEKREEWAGNAAARSDARFNAAHKIADAIPFGQPILVGHHSERHARRDQERIHNNLNKGVEEAKKAEHHASKAHGIEIALDRSIFDDDPDAIERLEARIAATAKANERAKEINKAWRKGGADGLRAIGCSEAFIETTLKTMALCPWLKSPMSTTGNGAAMRKDKERIEIIKKKRELHAKAEAAGGLLVEKVDGGTGYGAPANGYARVTFPEYPGREKIAALKAAGFHWSGASGSWFGEWDKLPEEVKS